MVGEDAIGISFQDQEGAGLLILEQSRLAAEAAVTFVESYGYNGARIEITDSHVSGSVRISDEQIRARGYAKHHHRRCDGTSNDYTCASTSRIRTIMGRGPRRLPTSSAITNTTVEGSVSAQRSATFDRLTVHGEVAFFGSPGRAGATISNSHIYSSSTAPALRLRYAGVTLRQTFVQGAQALASSGSEPARRPLRVC